MLWEAIAIGVVLSGVMLLLAAIRDSTRPFGETDRRETFGPLGPVPAGAPSLFAYLTIGWIVVGVLWFLRGRIEA